MSDRLQQSTVAIFGLGLMGGSLGLALQGKVARRIGVVRDAELVAQAESSGAVDAVMSRDDAFAAADIVVLAVPVREIARSVPDVAAQMREGALLTDLGSTKGAIVAAMDGIGGGVRAVGGHPMCGKETGGLANADAALFRGARYVLCPTTRTDDDSLGLARALAVAVGAEAVVLDADVHDRAVAAASHMPYAVSQCIVHAFAQAAADEPSVDQLAASGFRDATRVAGGDVTMWLDILLANRQAVDHELERVQHAVAELRSLLADEDTLRDWLVGGQQTRRGFDATTREAGGE